MSLPVPQIKAYTGSLASLSSSTDQYDGLIAVFTDPASLASFSVTAKSLAARDEAFGGTVQLIIDENVPGSRVVLAPTGSLAGDVDDVRMFQDVTQTATKRALSAGILRPLIYFVDPPSTSDPSAFTYSPETISDYARFVEVTLLAALAASFDPIDVREYYKSTGKNYKTLEKVGVIIPEGVTVHLGEDGIDRLLEIVRAVEEGRRVMKDIGSPDPERMTPSNCAAYIRDVAFAGVDNVKLTVIESHDVISKEYPLTWAVSRASLHVERHHPRIVKLEYRAPDQSKVRENLYFVGKGVTYDTGGADIKAGGVMRAMSRDKCGAASVAGFLKTVSLLAPDHVNITAGLSFVRNSVGSDSYVSDEVILSRAGVRVLIGNTDAEGRLVMTDLLTEFKDAALADETNSAPSILFTVATLTGHALRAYGGYGIALDTNFPARQLRVSRRIFDAGHVWGDPFEISTLRRDDMQAVAPGSTSEDVVQANDKPSSATMRGHQLPAGYLVIASGLDKHGSRAVPEQRVAYTHLDIAGSAETLDGVGLSLPTVTGSPVPALAGAFLL